MGYERIYNYRTGLKIINEGLLDHVLSVPSFSGNEKCMQACLMEQAKNLAFPASIDDKGKYTFVKALCPKETSTLV